MTDTLLNKISTSSTSTIITDAWLTGQTGAIVDIKGDYVFRFIDFIDNGELRHKHTTDESKLACPIVATGLVGFWLHRKDDIGIYILRLDSNPQEYTTNTPFLHHVSLHRHFGIPIG